MRIFDTIIFTVILVALISTSGFSAEKIIKDPYAGDGVREQVVQADPMDLDSRLSQKITYTAKSLPLRTIVSDLGALSGVKFYCGYNNMDWQVRDRRMVVFAKDVPLRDLLRSIARVMKFKWSVDKSIDPWTYRIFMDRNYLTETQNKLKKQLEDFKKHISERRKVILDRYEAFADSPEQNLESIKQSDPRLYWDAITGVAAPFGRLLKEVPFFKSLLVNGQSGLVLGSDLPPSAQDALIKLMQGTVNQKQMEGAQGVTSLPEDIANQAGDAKLWVINLSPEYTLDSVGSSLAAAMCGMYQVDIKGQLSPGYFSMLTDNDTKFAKTESSWFIQSYEQKVPIEQIESVNSADELDALAELAHLIPGEEPTAPPDDPSLQVKIKFLQETDSKKNHRFQDALESVAGTISQCLVADSYGGANQGAFPAPKPGEEITIGKLVQRLADGFNYNWDKHNSIIELRDRQWFRKRSLQIPDEWVDHWKAVLKRDGTLDIDNLAQMAELTRDQYMANLQDDEVLGKLSLWPFLLDKHVTLKALACLNDVQCKMAYSETGLDLGLLNKQQRGEAFGFICNWLSKGRQQVFEGVTLFGSRVRKGKAWDYSFKLITTDLGYEPVELKFTTPVPPDSK